MKPIRRHLFCFGVTFRNTKNGVSARKIRVLKKQRGETIKNKRRTVQIEILWCTFAHKNRENVDETPRHETFRQDSHGLGARQGFSRPAFVAFQAKCNSRDDYCWEGVARKFFRVGKKIRFFGHSRPLFLKSLAFPGGRRRPESQKVLTFHLAARQAPEKVARETPLGTAKGWRRPLVAPPPRLQKGSETSKRDEEEAFSRKGHAIRKAKKSRSKRQAAPFRLAPGCGRETPVPLRNALPVAPQRRFPKPSEASG